MEYYFHIRVLPIISDFKWSFNVASRHVNIACFPINKLSNSINLKKSSKIFGRCKFSQDSYADFINEQSIARRDYNKLMDQLQAKQNEAQALRNFLQGINQFLHGFFLVFFFFLKLVFVVIGFKGVAK